MSKPKRIGVLEDFASITIGDDKAPNLYFVTDQGVLVTITRDFDVAYAHWQTLAQRAPRVESSLEDRQHGVLASVEPDEENSNRLIVIDDTHWLLKTHA
jgi:hypothetical protein